MSIASLPYACRFIAWLLLALFSLSAVADDGPLDEDPEARGILEKSDEIRFPATGFQVDILITSSAPDQDADKRKYRVLSKGNDSTVVMMKIAGYAPLVVACLVI